MRSLHLQYQKISVDGKELPTRDGFRFLESFEKTTMLPMGKCEVPYKIVDIIVGLKVEVNTSWDTVRGWTRLINATWTPMEKITSEFMAADNKETLLVLHEPGYYRPVLYLS